MCSRVSCIVSRFSVFICCDFSFFFLHFYFHFFFFLFIFIQFSLWSIWPLYELNGTQRAYLSVWERVSAYNFLFDCISIFTHLFRVIWMDTSARQKERERKVWINKYCFARRFRIYFERASHDFRSVLVFNQIIVASVSVCAICVCVCVCMCLSNWLSQRAVNWHGVSEPKNTSHK